MVLAAILALFYWIFTPIAVSSTTSSTKISIAPAKEIPDPGKKIDQIATSSPAKASRIATSTDPNVGLEALIRKEFADTPVMIEISRCESHFRQFEKDGSVHRGEINPQDVGLFQVNEHYHLEESKKLGIDIYTVAGNIAFAKLLYARNGTRDWNWSKSCWQPASEK